VVKKRIIRKKNFLRYLHYTIRRACRQADGVFVYPIGREVDLNATKCNRKAQEGEQADGTDQEAIGFRSASSAGERKKEWLAKTQRVCRKAGFARINPPDPLVKGELPHFRIRF
jgi:hypothetical protein